MFDAKNHWENVYISKDIDQVGWYEERPIPSLNLIIKCDLNEDDCIVDVGVGASTLIDCLLDEGFCDVVAADISAKALNKLKERLGEKESQKVRWVVDDITKSEHLTKLRNVSLWHDRALLHFLTDEKDQQAYLEVLKSVVKPGGYVIISVFSLKGVKKCSGLDVKCYDERMLSDFLGPEFDLIEYFDYLYVTPSGQSRPYIYTMFQRKE